MRRSLTTGLAVLAAVVVSQVPATAGSQARHTCSVALTGRFTEVMVNSGNPPRSGSNTGVATVDGTMCGKAFHGAARDVNYFPRFGKVYGVGVIYGPLGSIRVKFEATATVNPDHSASLRGSSTITGGTGVYARATGSGTDIGRQPRNSPVTIQRLSGTLDY